MRISTWIVILVLSLNAMGLCRSYLPAKTPTPALTVDPEPAQKVQDTPQTQIPAASSPVEVAQSQPAAPVLETAAPEIESQSLPPEPPMDTVPPRIVILMIGDGMGFEEVRAARMYAGSEMSFERLPYQSSMITLSAGGSVTDSAAASTAMATGRKVENGVISQAIPGDGSDLLTLLEEQAAQGKRTGLVTTSYLTDATPAGLAAHEPARSNLEEIASDYLNQTRPNLLLGGGGRGLTPQEALDAGYTAVTDRAGLKALDLNALEFVSGQFGETYMPYELDGLGDLPHLSEMTAAALDLLEEDPDGFFLMVEGGRIDHAGHANDLPHAVAEVIEFSNAVDVVMQWASARSDTLVIVTADHETGGLRVTQDNGPGQYPSVEWIDSHHTAALVPVYAFGLNASLVWGRLDNTEIRSVIYGERIPLFMRVRLPHLSR